MYIYTRALTRSAPATVVHLPRLRVARNSSTTLLNCLERGLGERSKYPLGLLSPTTVSRGCRAAQNAGLGLVFPKMRGGGARCTQGKNLPGRPEQHGE